MPRASSGGPVVARPGLSFRKEQSHVERPVQRPRRRGARPPQGVPPPEPPEAGREQVQTQKRASLQERARAARRQLHDAARRVRRDPRPERIGQVDARAPAVDAAAARRRQRQGVRARRVHGAALRAAARQPGLGRGELLQEDVRGREPRLRIALLRHDLGRHEGRDPADPRAGRLPQGAADRADGEPVAGHAAEGRARAGAAHEPGPAAARRADDRARSAVEARGAGVHQGGAVGARRDDPPLHARPRRGGGARRPDRRARPRRAARARAGRRADGALRRVDARGGVLRRDRPHVRGRGRRRDDDDEREVFA